MTYDFKNLSHADFEDLARDLIGKEIDVRFEAFCAGPDGGVDGRHAPSGGSGIILQAKHLEGSAFSQLSAAMRKERKSIDALAPSRYLLATSCKFTPNKKGELANIIGPALQAQEDIFGPGDLNGLLRKFPEVLKAHIKLWLSGTGVLERVLRAAAAAFTTMTTEEIEQKVRVYAPNPSFDASLETLEEHHVLIISGPPGVGKTTLAEMLCYAFIGEEWELVPIRSLEDGFSAIDDSRKQVFFFDDFLGRVALDKQALAHKDSDLARFMSRVRRSPNARFILTTRGYIFEEARRVSEHLADTRLDVSKYVLDVGIYTRRIKARILYNHLLVSGTPKPFIRALLEAKSEDMFGDQESALSLIIDHRNYNPRVIEYMTDVFRLGKVAPEEYPQAFLRALDNPSQIWDTAFRTHIDHRCRHLLIAMFFAQEFGVNSAELRVMFDSLHPALSASYGLPHGPKDYEEAVRILEGSFIGIYRGRVSYVNPSLKDYLSGYLADAELLALVFPSAKTIDWIYSLWQFACRKLPDTDARKRIANSAIGLLDLFESRLVWQKSKNDPSTLVHGDASNSTRINLLIEWWRLTDDIRFADRAVSIARKPVQGFDGWRDGEALLDLILEADDDKHTHPFIHNDELRVLLEDGLADLIRWHMFSDDLARLDAAIELKSKHIPEKILSALEAAIHEEFDEISERVRHEDSESTLSDKIDVLKKLAARHKIPDQKLSFALSRIEERITEIGEETTSSSSPDFKASGATDRFDNKALRNLFAPLAED